MQRILQLRNIREKLENYLSQVVLQLNGGDTNLISMIANNQSEQALALFFNGANKPEELKENNQYNKYLNLYQYWIKMHNDRSMPVPDLTWTNADINLKTQRVKKSKKPTTKEEKD